MENKHHAFSLFNYEEIIGRFLSITSKFEGPSCFPVRISFVADNMSGPPEISAQVMNIRNDGKAETIFSCSIDQNTSLDAFQRALSVLSAVTEKILKSLSENIPFEELDKNKEEPIDDTPF